MNYFKLLIVFIILLFNFCGFSQDPKVLEEPGILKKFKVIDHIYKIKELKPDNRNYKLSPDSLKVSWFSQGSSQSYSDTTFYKFKFLDDDTKKLFDTVFMYDQRNGHDYVVTYQYNNAFKRTRIDFYKKTGNFLNYYGSEIYKYDDQNTAIKYECNLPNYVDQDSMRYVYDDQNRIIEHYDYEYTWQNQWILRRQLDSIDYNSSNEVNGYVEQGEFSRTKYIELKWKEYNPNYMFYQLDPEIDFDYVHLNSNENYFNYRDPESIFLSGPTDFVQFTSDGIGHPYNINKIKKTIFNSGSLEQITDYIYLSGDSNRDSLHIDLSNDLINQVDKYYNGQFQSRRTFRYNDDDLLIKDSISSGWIFDLTYEIDSEMNLLLYEIDLHKSGVQDDRTKYEFYTLGTLSHNEIEEKAKTVKIYPNPVNDLISVDLIENNFGLNVPWCLYDLSGKEVMQGEAEYSSFVINVDLLASGIYYFKLYNSGSTIISKFIKL